MSSSDDRNLPEKPKSEPTDQLIVLDIPQNSKFHGRVEKVHPNRKTFRHKALFTKDYEFVYNRTSRKKAVTHKDLPRMAVVFAFDRIEQSVKGKRKTLEQINEKIAERRAFRQEPEQGD